MTHMSHKPDVQREAVGTQIEHRLLCIYTTLPNTTAKFNGLKKISNVNNIKRMPKHFPVLERFPASVDRTHKLCKPPLLPSSRMKQAYQIKLFSATRSTWPDCFTPDDGRRFVLQNGACVVITANCCGIQHSIDRAQKKLTQNGRLAVCIKLHVKQGTTT